MKADSDDGIQCDGNGEIIVASPFMTTVNSCHQTTEAAEGKCSTIKENDDRVFGRLKKSLGLHKALVLVLLACLCRAFLSITVKMLAGKVSSLHIAVCNSLTIFVSSSPILLWCRISPRIAFRNVPWLFAWTFAETVVICTIYYAFQNIPAGDAIAILMSNSIFTGFLAWFLLRERFTRVDVVLAVIALIGVILIARPSFIFGTHSSTTPHVGNTTLGVTAALSATVSLAVSRVTCRKLAGVNVHPFLQLWFLGLIACIYVSILTSALGMWELPPCGRDRAVFFLSGLLSLVSSILTILALKMEKAANVSMFLSNTVILTFIIEFLIFGTVPNWLSVVGAAFIIFSSLAMSIHKLKSVKE